MDSARRRFQAVLVLKVEETGDGGRNNGAHGNVTLGEAPEPSLSI